MSLSDPTQAKCKRNRRRRVRPSRFFPLRGEQLEPREMLSVVVPVLSTGQELVFRGTVGSALTDAGLNYLLPLIPSSTLEAFPPNDISVVYHAFPQEVNDLKVTADLLNTFLFLDEQGNDALVYRVTPAFNDDLLEELQVTVEFIGGVELSPMHLLGLDFPDVDAIVPNPDALSVFVPSEIQETFEVADQILNTRVFPGLKLGRIQIIDDLTVGRLIKQVVPGLVDDLLIEMIEFLGSGSRGGLLLHLLDGDDRADLSNLSGVVQEVHGGVGNDILMGGGSDSALDVLGSTGLGPITWASAKSRIDLFGEEGSDTFVVNRKFNVKNYQVDGGEGNDILVVPGTEGNDIIRIVTDSSGQVEKIEFLAPGDGGSARNEKQKVTLPAGATGTFTLTFGGHTTGNIPAGASAGDVEAELEKLSSIDGVSVTGPAKGPWTVEFDGPSFASKDQLNMAANGTGLTVPGGGVSVEVSREGDSANYNEIQRIELPDDTKGGTFVLKFGGHTTDPIPASAGKSEIRQALGALPSIDGSDNIEVTSDNSTGGPWTVEFIGDLAGANQNLMEAPDTEIRLIGFAGNGGVSMTPDGVLRVNEKQGLQISGASGGTFKLTFNGFQTDPIPYNASAFVVNNIVKILPSIGGDANIDVTGSSGDWVFEFTGALGGVDQPSLTVDTASLTGGPITHQVTDVDPPAEAGNDEVQEVSIDSDANGGTFTLTFDGEETDPIDFDASAAAVRQTLGNLSSVGDEENVEVTGSTPTWTVTFVNDLGLDNQPQMTIDESLLATPEPIAVAEDRTGGVPVNEVQTISLPFNVDGGTFTLTFDGETTAPLVFDATAAQVQAALNSLATIDSIVVSGADGGPWSVEFRGGDAGTNVSALISGDGSALQLKGLGIDVTEVQSGSAGGDTQTLVTTEFTDLNSVEQLRIEGLGGDDRLILDGVPTFSQGVFFDAGGGTDVLEILSVDASPHFVSPIFPNGTAATVSVDEQAIQFADLEGNLIYDAGGKVAAASLSGTNAGNQMRFNATGEGAATFANDGQVTTTLRNFGEGSTISLLGQQGGDEIAVQLNGDTTFTAFNIDGGGPAGVDTVRFEGTPSGDAFDFTPGGTVEDGQVVLDSAVTLNYTGASGVTFVGLGGTDSLTVNQAAADTNDTVLFFPKVGNDGSFQVTSQPGGATTALVYPEVTFASIEQRTFSTGVGTDTLRISTDDLPGVNSSAAVIGGNGTTTADFGDQSTTFIHDTTDEDTLALEIGTADDQVEVTPGTGIRIAVNTALGTDLLTYRGNVSDVTLDVPTSTISQTGVSDVTFSSAETVDIVGNGSNALTVLGAALENTYVYTPLGAQRGRFTTDQTLADFAFREIGGTFTLGGGASPRDSVTVEGSLGPDILFVDGPNRTVRVTDPTSTNLKPVVLAANVEMAGIRGGEGDDRLGVEPGADLFVHVDGGLPNARDRVWIEDAGPGDLVLHREGYDRRSGSVVVGSLKPVDYVNAERVDILPLDAVTGGTGSDELGRLVVFDRDPFEHNESLPTNTRFLVLSEVAVNPTIDPGFDIGSYPDGPQLPGDEDWFEFLAPKIGTFRFDVFFERITAVGNGGVGLPGYGDLGIAVYNSGGDLMVHGRADNAGANAEVTASATFSAAEGEVYYLRVRGGSEARADADSINTYSARVVEADVLGPQVFDPDGAGPEQAIQIVTAGMPNAEFNLFGLKPNGTDQGPTPLVDGLLINVRDLLTRELLERQVGDLLSEVYPALDEIVAETVGNYRLVGDHHGIIPIANVVVNNNLADDRRYVSAQVTTQNNAGTFTAAGLIGSEIVAGDFVIFEDGTKDPDLHGQIRQIAAFDSTTGRITVSEPFLDLPLNGDAFTVLRMATATITLNFSQPLPDDRFTLTMFDSIVDPAGNAFDGRGTASQPAASPTFPSGDGVSGGDFVARFTVDSRAEIGVWAAGTVYLDTNGNFTFDPLNLDAVNRDISYTFGLTSDYVFAGNFAKDGVADGFDKLAAYGKVGDGFRWLIDLDSDGVPDVNSTSVPSLVGIPVAGDFNASHPGDEVGLFTGSQWYFDDGSFTLSGATAVSSGIQGHPVVGDFDDDGKEDLGTWDTRQNVFHLSLSASGGGLNAVETVQFSLGEGSPFIGTQERPVAADMDGDGIDDLGLWVPDRSGAAPGEMAEWYFLLSGGRPITQRISSGTSGNAVQFTPVPFGRALYAQFGDEFGVPVVGNFDPPPTLDSQATTSFLTDGSETSTASADGSTAEASVWRNAKNPLDTTDDGLVSARDALVIINFIEEFGIGKTPTSTPNPLQGVFYLDASGNLRVEPQDALLIINYLSNPPAAAGEGEAAPSWDSGPMDVSASLRFPADGSTAGRGEWLGSAQNGDLASRRGLANVLKPGNENDQSRFRRPNAEESLEGADEGALASSIDDIAFDICHAWLHGGS